MEMDEFEMENENFPLLSRECVCSLQLMKIHLK